MATLTEATAGHTRDLPIMASLRSALITAAERAGIDRVVVTSGGQAKKGTPGKRTGSIRHDLGGAADLYLQKDGKVLSFENPAERPIIARFVTECSRLGCTGIGAGIGYMGPHTLHVGYGSRATWGAGGKSANAPGWLIAAVAAASGHASPPAASAPRTLKEGMSGPDVFALQGKVGVRQDGKFGQRTKDAVMSVQAAHGLTQDGIVGSATRAALGL